MVEIAFLAKRGEDDHSRRRSRQMKEAGVSTRCRAEARRSSPIAYGTSSATTRSTAANGWRPLGLAHKMGFRSNATMLYGHVEEIEEDRVDHLMRLREVQDETGGFQTFIPLSFHPDQHGPLAHSQVHGHARHTPDCRRVV